VTTPGTMNSILERLRDKIGDAEEEAAESHKAAMNSYGAGYDRGYADALKEMLADITGDSE
jgi:hypothetical protein